MTTTAGAIVYKNTVLTVDDTDYADQHTKGRLVPSYSIQTVKTAVPGGVYQDIDEPTWMFEISGLQINTVDGLAEYLRENAGSTITVVLQPKDGTGQKKATFDCIALATEFGGESGTFMTIDISLPVLGAPVFGTSS
jgi:hypothetical protein